MPGPALSHRFTKQYLDTLHMAMRNERRATQRSILEQNSSSVFLDCGCREGNDTLEFAERIGTDLILGIDYNLAVLQQAKHKGICPLLSDLNYSIPLKKDSVDVIVASNIIEHLVDPYIFVAEMFRVLRPGGYVALDTPNLASWHNIFALLLGIQPFSGPNITTMDDAELSLVQDMHRSNSYFLGGRGVLKGDERKLNRHIVVLAYISLLRLFIKHGFQIDRVQAFGYYPFPPLLARLFQRLDPRHAHHILVKARKPK